MVNIRIEGQWHAAPDFDDRHTYPDMWPVTVRRFSDTGSDAQARICSRHISTTVITPIYERQTPFA